ncbi:hypothetical protein C8Q73DRAFT_766924 [Cubamyces lactineus]|nr:hypothetical protein C8Q73DRAFT_766924 [Cubamyces lactineus]
MQAPVRFHPYTARQRRLITGVRTPVPLRPRDMRAGPVQTVRYATPAEELVEALLSGKSLGLDHSDVCAPIAYYNFEVEIRVRESPGKVEGVFQDHPTYTLSIHLKPIRYMRTLTVTLEAWQGALYAHRVNSGSAPSWTWGIRGEHGFQYVKGIDGWHARRVRNYVWIWEFVSQLFLSHNRLIADLPVWIKLWKYVDELKAYDAVASRIAAASARGVYRPRPRPRPVRSSRDLVVPFAALSMEDTEVDGHV